MCGIFAIAGEKVSSIEDRRVADILQSLGKRGPDDQDSVRFGRCILGQTRLSILDIGGGHQPMRDNAQPITVVFNGEIYNYKDLRAKLEAKGHHFSTNSDTEAILKAYIEYGEGCPKYLDGMFAFVLWNEATGELFCARDRFGKKPFYYAEQNGKIYVASEIKALKKAGVKMELDWGAVDNFLTLMYVPPWKSVYSNVKVLSPAHSAIFKNSTWSVQRYWDMPESPIDVSYADAKEHIKMLLKKSVEKRMVADVEIGSFLSGGVDSTLLTYLAQQCSPRPLKTFSVGYGEYVNELPFAKEASEKIGSDHYTLQSGGNMVEKLKKVIAYMDEPHADSSNISQYLVSQLAGSKVKVALTGDGADELFLGYGWHTHYQHQSKIKRLRNFFFSNQLREHIRYISVFNREERQKIWKDSSCMNDDIYAEGMSRASRGFKKVNYFDLTTYLPGQLLSKIDRTSMMNSLEVRSPFLDTELAEYVYNIPRAYKNDGMGYKIILKDILSEIMPKEFVYRRKMGFGAPVYHWLLEPAMQKSVLETLRNPRACIFEKIHREYVEKKVSDFYSTKDKKHSYHVWMFFCLELWLQSIQ